MFKILIAEDDRELRQLFAHVLTKNGYTVLGVSNGEEALDALERSGPARYGHEIVPAGVLYVPARDVLIPADRRLSPEEAPV